MARPNMSSRADFFKGRSTKWGEVRISFAMDGSDETTVGVEPTLKAMREVADIPRAIESRVRWASPWVREKMLPKNGSPLGPGIGTDPNLFRPFFHANPPLENAQVRKTEETTAMTREAKTKPSQMVSVPKKAGRVKTHQLLSLEPNPMLDSIKASERRRTDGFRFQTPKGFI